MKLRFRQVDVFTRVPFRGNPVAVVLDAKDLSGEEMQRIAGWTNLSETTFVLPPSTSAADYRLRIFTPRSELPFAGHPTIGSAHAVVEAGVVQPIGGKLRQECGAGILELEVDGDLIWVRSPPLTVSAWDSEDRREIAAALGARIEADPQVVDVGPVWLVADLGGAAAVGALQPNLEAVTELSVRRNLTGITVFGASGGDGSAIHLRSFAPAHGIPEDPVCGSGNISVAAYLSQAGLLARFGSSYRARQGLALGRDGQVAMRVENGAIFLGGNAVTCVEGDIRVS